MKKLIVALICAILTCAMATPASLAASNAIEFELDGQALTLNFDPSEQFSSITGGNVQASFYAYMDGSNDLYELYMIFPRDVQAGAVIDPEYARQNAPETSVVLIITKKDSVDYYFAGQTDSTDTTDYTLTFESVSDSGNDRTYVGTLSASMIGMADGSEHELKPINIRNANFSFTMSMRADRLPEETPGDSLPPATDDPFGGDYDPFNPYADPTPAPSRETYRV